ncbi:hypothetical protein [Paraflavitalea speifideaquila]|uniref:hypothetical protein n=1 Tax=Paraflavitalea speifideaquila TaxID=3076558 RepID=UPI0028E5AC18|nr:hypothetical protein [Paraflavitalea speifideiaquila]
MALPQEARKNKVLMIKGSEGISWGKDKKAENSMQSFEGYNLGWGSVVLAGDAGYAGY